MILVGLSGTNGSGKGTLGHILAEDYNFLFISVSDLLREEATKRGLPLEREVLRTISAEWRREFGLGVLVDRAVDAYHKAIAEGASYVGLVADPMRNSGEAQHLKNIGGTLIWVDADPKVRYERIKARHRTVEDEKTYEQFLAEEQEEMVTTGDAATLNMADVKKIADVVLVNDSHDIAQFRTEAEQQLAAILNAA